ncbi:energy-coupling factor ABC transporter ATP-binding protein [Methanocorpusculum vombati]|uniref:ABC transporter ATP-binding protein n=1 Tax=Methanocorpusculum vombati TaxID=3002864 RepID=A0ABT4INM7_9EURY|nr:ATP-binding cassette domain-containing protein [Methanocorpusculum vombati]MCZ0863372.1 ATP-binding cassette domain-containing protein [Methanocorpusculum vombati]MDE2519750.1 ATP-binding cassette domain-containing protein [Methanocorpusculum sp.]HJK78184.1 ATP-binding cassette domain-containing protein [Methanocorpusculum sp.]HJK80142.1 ATP-binding cassette domain-containing protein [Methanocorpusculum sp.]
MSDYVLEFDDIWYSYPNRPPSLKGVSFAIERGKKVAVVGPNGAGKTTLLLMCNGTLVPEKGCVRVDGEEVVYDRAALRRVRSAVGLVFQNSDAQVFAPSVYADVAFGPANLRLPEEEVRARVADALFAVGLTGYERRPPHHLSGGERKRVAIAGILAMRPEILVADEPTASLDPATAVEIMDLLDELHEDGTTILLSTHDVELAYRWADEVILLGGGELLHQGTPAAVFTDRDLMRGARLTPPVLLDLYMELLRRGLVAGAVPPKGIPEMTQLIAGAAEGGVRSLGRVFLADTDGLTRERFAELCAECPGRRTGAMGTRAKRFCHDAGYLPDYTYGVVDKCLLSAMTGEDTLILTCGGMLDRVELRARVFAEESGVVVPVVRV